MTARQQLLADVLTTAIEGGSNYWLNDIASDGGLQAYDVQRTPEGDPLLMRLVVAAVEDVAGAKVRRDLAPEYVKGEHGSFALVHINHGILSAAAMQVVTREVKVRKDIRAAANTIAFGPAEDADYDAEVADVILQVAVFGEVIYG